MRKSQYDHILALAQRPSSYLGGEINTVVKNDPGIKMRMALAFPDTYEIGTSHFGMQILYGLINSRPDAAAERVFAPGNDMADLLKSFSAPLFSLETRRPLSDFDILGFSLLYELNYTNVLMMLDLAGIPFYARDRGSGFPLVIAGGPCTVNPEPVAPFFDAMVVGDGEPVVPALIDSWIQWKESGCAQKTELLNQWADIRGVYIPSFFEAVADQGGRQKTISLMAGYEKVCRSVAPDLDQAPFPDKPVIPFGRPVHDRLRLEIARGCTRGCRFCQAGMIYRPVRERSLDVLAGLAEKCLANTGYDDLSLLSLSTGDYTCLTPLMQHLSDKYFSSRLAISIPSFRAGTLSPGLMDLIRGIRKTGFTIAPEAGSPRLRSVINKNITEDEISQTVSAAFDLGWQLIKLYFMIGLPTETQEDVDEIVELVKRLKKLRPRGKRGGNINVSVATFIPKPHVPFQWCGQQDPDSARQKIEFLRRRLSAKGVDFKWQDPDISRLEGVFARGDRRLASVLVAAYENGCRFDGWTDSFNKQAWQKAFIETGVDADEFLQPIDPEANLAWDHIDIGVSLKFLKAEYQRALSGQSTEDCRLGDCQGCGVCDFDQYQPKTAADKNPGCRPAAFQAAQDMAGGEKASRVRFFYTKLGSARFFGQLEMVNIFLRAFKRAGVVPAYSAGFHPKPKIAFGDALPVGMESLAESFYLTITSYDPCVDICGAINSQLPEGLEITGCLSASNLKSVPQRSNQAEYRISLGDGFRFDSLEYQAFQDAKSFEAFFSSKKGEKAVNLKDVVIRLFRVKPECLQITLAQPEGITLRPGWVVAAIFKSLPGDALQQARIIKLSQDISNAGAGSGSGDIL
jgi:radical SAM family uncharacterized protein/radical SAM-linked protein